MNRYSPECSVIIPVYNAEKTIRNALDSIVPEDPADIGTEILVIDDGSTDSTASIVQEYEERYSAVKLIQKENGGVSSARNRGLEEAGGKYIYFMDADDKADRNTLLALLKTARQTKSDVFIADFEIYDAVNEQLKTIKIDLPPDVLMDKEAVEEKILYRFFDRHTEGLNQLWNKLYLSDVIRENDLRFNENRTHGEDWEFNIRFFDVSGSAYYYPAVMYRYQTDGSQRLVKYKEKLIDGYIDGYSLLSQTARKHSLDRLNPLIPYMIQRDAAFNLIKCLQSDDFSESEKRAIMNRREVKPLFRSLASLENEALSPLSLSRKDKVGFRLLSLGLYQPALKLILER